MASRKDLLFKVIGWGVGAMLITGGWFINPNTTHYIDHKTSPALFKEIDRISFMESKQNVTDEAYRRASALLCFSLAGLVLWCSLIFYICRSKTLSSDFLIEGALKNQVLAFVAIVSIAYLFLVFSVVEFWPFNR